MKPILVETWVQRPLKMWSLREWVRALNSNCLIIIITQQLVSNQQAGLLGSSLKF